MSEKPEALMLAEELDHDAKSEIFCYLNLDKAAAELRRLHAENERLREALTYDWDQLEACRESLREHMVEIKRLREALEHMIDVYLGQVQNDGGYTVLDSVRPLIADKAALRREET